MVQLIKKSTDILIYTDSFCFSAGSGFIKAFQNTGGAIIVGFKGNPKISKDEFDASQSSSSVAEFRDEEYYNLETSLPTSTSYWTISPAYADSTDSYIVALDEYGYTWKMWWPMGIRPVISINSSTTVSSGSGSENEPWIIE